MTSIHLTQTQILELIILEIENSNYQEVANLAQNLIDKEKDEIKEFEIDKYYEHKSGKTIHILDAIKTTFYGYCLVAETSSGNLEPVDEHADATIGWEEIDEHEWLKNFS